MYATAFFIRTLSESNINEQMTHLIISVACTLRETLSKKSKLVSITTSQIQNLLRHVKHMRMMIFISQLLSNKTHRRIPV
jgi:hypothetical protein